jgi:hypothetical protein
MSTTFMKMPPALRLERVGDLPARQHIVPAAICGASNGCSNSHFGPSGCHIVMAGLVPAIHRGTVLRGWPEQVWP